MNVCSVWKVCIHVVMYDYIMHSLMLSITQKSPLDLVLLINGSLFNDGLMNRTTCSPECSWHV